MILLVDIGNSRLKWASLTADHFEYGGAVSYTEENLPSLLSSIWSVIIVPEKVVVANVAGDIVANLITQWVNEHFHCRVQMVMTKKEYLGVTNAYTQPQQFGVDRWMAILAVWQEFNTGFCVVDCGTAVTFDAVDHNGQHLGGLILPGIEMMQGSLMEQLPGCSQPKPHNSSQSTLLANNTYHAITGACLYATIAFINHLTEELLEELGGDTMCIITGGNAQKILPMLQQDYQYRPHLVLQGLALIA